jgi:hypothetical protein
MCRVNSSKANYRYNSNNNKNAEIKTISVTGRGGLQVCEMLRIHIVQTISSQKAERLSASCTIRALLPINIFIYVYAIQLCWSLSKLQDLLCPEGLSKLIKFNYVIGFEPATFQPVALCLNQYGTVYPLNNSIHFNSILI